MGVSNRNAQDNIQSKGDKKTSSGTSHKQERFSKKNSQELHNEQTNSQEDIKKRKYCNQTSNHKTMIQPKKLRTVLKRQGF